MPSSDLANLGQGHLDTKRFNHEILEIHENKQGENRRKR